MGRGSRWEADESLAVAQAWMSVSEDEGSPEVRGTNQDQGVFWSNAVAKFKSLAPAGQSLAGKYHNREDTAIQNHWRDTISRGVKKFNKNLRLVLSSQPTGCTEQQKINMAVAIHLGKVDAVNYRHRDFDARDWKLHQCWVLLKEHRAFQPPVPSIPVEEDEDEEEDDVGLSLGAVDDNADFDAFAALPNDDTTADTPIQSRALFNSSVAAVPGSASRANTVGTVAATAAGSASGSSSSGRHSRGAAGRTVTKRNTSNDECKKRKQKAALDGMLEVQRRRQEDFSQCVQNQARVAAFTMAQTMYQQFLAAGNLTKAEECQEKMEGMLYHPREEEEDDDDATAGNA